MVDGNVVYERKKNMQVECQSNESLSYVKYYQDSVGECSHRWEQIWGYLEILELHDTHIKLSNGVTLKCGDSENSEARSIVFMNRQSIYTFGRDSTCDMIVNKLSVSSRHFHIYKETINELHVVRVSISDTSLNGTFVNGVQLKRGI